MQPVLCMLNKDKKRDFFSLSFQSSQKEVLSSLALLRSLKGRIFSSLIKAFPQPPLIHFCVSCDLHQMGIYLVQQICKFQLYVDAVDSGRMYQKDSIMLTDNSQGSFPVILIVERLLD